MISNKYINAIIATLTTITILFTTIFYINTKNIDNINTNLLIEKDYPIELSDIIQNFLEESGPLDTVEKAFSLDSLLQNVEKYARTNFISTTLLMLILFLIKIK